MNLVDLWELIGIGIGIGIGAESLKACHNGRGIGWSCLVLPLATAGTAASTWVRGLSTTARLGNTYAAFARKRVISSNSVLLKRQEIEIGTERTGIATETCQGIGTGIEIAISGTLRGTSRTRQDVVEAAHDSYSTCLPTYPPTFHRRRSRSSTNSCDVESLTSKLQN